MSILRRSSAGVLPFTRRAVFKCLLPRSSRRFLPFPQPVVTELRGAGAPRSWFPRGSSSTSVTSSNQEVFRCLRPRNASTRRLVSGGNDSETVKVSLEVGQGGESRVVPSVAYYRPGRKIALGGTKSLLCACTMVYNVAKFLREWVVYHSNIGVDRFVLYDNGSDDGLEKVVKKLLEENYEVSTILWPWTKTQEAGFSHCAMYAKDSCTWMMYIDVDEFIYSPSWLNASNPSPQMLKSLLHINSSSLSSSSSLSQLPIGQILIWCYEYGPSNQTVHPKEGVTQGYTCRREEEQRHKSIVLVEAIDASLFNAIHHFQLKEGYSARTLSANEGAVNHYKFQAWPEFMVKFRRRVSAYVVDWRQALNPMSNDRTPGLGFEPIEPKGWTERFCEVHDDRLKEATRRWFGVDSSDDQYNMVWQKQ
ncbi:hypothetical protein Syun_005618 [Stephania yunnanensis]|uniref:Glycosyltransferase family 92 protein n=1 Tax=Stephania yunnanensis TaxID=152371 RepID=A0AAP0L5I2_9MAGN